MGPPYINGDMFKFPEKIDISKKGVNSEKKISEKFFVKIKYYY